MEERFVPGTAAEARPLSADGRPRTVEGHAGAGEAAAAGTTPALDDPRALQILTTEHWALLTARSLVYNEAFARAGMFLAFLSATMLVLGLISTATGFSDSFLIIAAVLLSLDLFTGFATLGRISAASHEDIRYLQGMNRLRHAYHEIVPGLDAYFSTSPFDDFRSTVSPYSTTPFSGIRSLVHGFTTTPGMISVICSAVGGGLVAVLVLLVVRDPVLASVGGIAAAVLLFALATAVAIGSVAGLGRSFEVRFPAPLATPTRPPTAAPSVRGERSERG